MPRPRLHPVDLITSQYRAPARVGRNDACPGGCGKKSKRCACRAPPVMEPVVPAVLQRHEDVFRNDAPASTWSLSHNVWEGPPANRPVVNMRCRNDHLARLGPRHVISQDGTVNPSIGCHACGYHVWGRLENWTPPPPEMPEAYTRLP